MKKINPKTNTGLIFRDLGVSIDHPKEVVLISVKTRDNAVIFDFDFEGKRPFPSSLERIKIKELQKEIKSLKSINKRLIKEQEELFK